MLPCMRRAAHDTFFHPHLTACFKDKWIHPQLEEPRPPRMHAHRLHFRALDITATHMTVQS